MKKEMLVNISQAEECRIAILENGRLEELFTERSSQDNWVGNIYKGKIVNIEPSIQAAFVDFGVGRNGFLHISDVEPQYFRQGGYDPAEIADRFEDDRPPRRRPGGPAAAGEGEGEGDEADEGEDAEAASVGGEEPRRSSRGRGGRGGRSGRDEGREGSRDGSRDGGRDGERSGPRDRGGFGGLDDDGFGEAPSVIDDDFDGDEAVDRDGGDRDGSDRDGSDRDGGDRDGGDRDGGDRDGARGRVRGDREGRGERGGRGDREARGARGDREGRGDRGGRGDREARGDREGGGGGDRESRGDREGRGGRGGPRRQSALLKSGRPRFKPPIQEIFRRGDEVLVQVIKEGIGTKGPTLSTYISVPGRYIVLMPALGRVGVSKKIESESARRRLRDIMRELQPPKGVGLIVRTAGEDRTASELSRDVNYLVRVWKLLCKRLQSVTAPGVIYEESDMMIRTIRDNFTGDIDRIVVDSEDAYQRALDFVRITMPKFAPRLNLYAESEPLFHRFKIEEEITRIQQRVVPLPNGGSLVIDQTEALVAIDVNSGSFRKDESAEENAFQLNMAAAKEIARQLRLRDLGGVIVNDFIDMRKESHQRKVENTLRDATRRDRAKTKILRTSPFGLIEMTRQRIRPSFKRSVYEDCPCCKGRGLVKTAESMAIEVYRVLIIAAQTGNAARISVKVNENVAAYLNNRKRRELMKIEEQTGVSLLVLGSESQFPEQCVLEVRDRDNNLVTTPLLQSLQMI